MTKENRAIWKEKIEQRPENKGKEWITSYNKETKSWLDHLVHFRIRFNGTGRDAELNRLSSQLYNDKMTRLKNRKTDSDSDSD